MTISDRMQAFLNRKKKNNAFRQIQNKSHLIDFSSNDYLSLSQNDYLKNIIHQKSKKYPLGATGSRLLSGHFELLEQLEYFLTTFHQAEAALVFNSGYNANLSLLAALPRRSDIILYDDLIHASIHDGLRLSNAQAFAFAHNDTLALKNLLEQHQNKTIFVVVESIYSMDGDAAPLLHIAKLCNQYQANLIVDEAHSTGLFAPRGEGLCVALGIEKQVFARVHTFGKALGSHGAAIVGSQLLKDYLINYARPLIYTTTISPKAVLTSLENYRFLAQNGATLISILHQKINFFKQNITDIPTSNYIPSTSPIQSIIIPTNKAATQAATIIQQQGFDVRPIRFPTVAQGKERLRICLHLHNSNADITLLCNSLKSLLV